MILQLLFLIIKKLSKDRIIAKSVDNRFGVGLAMKMISKLDKIELPYNIAIGATVQEEVGLRGAETSVNTIKPDVFIALDASPVDDLNGKSDYSLGKGFLLRMYDPRNTMPEYLKNALVNLANKNKIKFQYYISKGGTDAAKALDMFDGVVSTTIGLPARYIHSPLAVFDTNDLKYAEKFLLTLIMNLDENKILLLKNGDLMYSKLSNNVKMPLIGLGTYLLDNKKIEKIATEAIKIGYRHFDTAQMYNNSIGLGKAISHSKIPRKDLFYHFKTMGTLYF